MSACDPQIVTAAPLGSSIIMRTRASLVPQTAHPPLVGINAARARFRFSILEGSHST
jgi:hypothetical protein